MPRRAVAVSLVVLGLAAASLHARPAAELDSARRRVSMEAQMHPVLLKAISFDLGHSIAAIKWLDSLVVAGDFMVRGEFKGPQKTWLFKSLRSQIYLDPYGLDTYFMAGGVFTFKPPSYPQFAANLLLYGALHRTEDWRIAMSLGQLLYSNYDGKSEAERVWEYGARMAHTPDWLPGLVAMLKVERNDLVSAELLLRTMLGEDRFGDASNPFGAEMKKMHLAIKDMQKLQRIADEYERHYGEVLPNLEKLVAIGVLRHVPPDPWGGQYWWDAQAKKAYASERLTPFAREQEAIGFPPVWLKPSVAHNLLSYQWGIIN